MQFIRVIIIEIELPPNIGIHNYFPCGKDVFLTSKASKLKWFL